MTALERMKMHLLKGATASVLIGLLTTAFAEQPPAPCHPNRNAEDDREAVAGRGDVSNLPKPLKDRLVRLADRPHSYLPLQVFAEADKSSQLFQYYLLDTGGFEPNVFTRIFPGVNDNVQLTATGIDCGLPAIGAVRLLLEPKPGFRPIRTTRKPLSISSPTSLACLSSTTRADGMKDG